MRPEPVVGDRPSVTTFLFTDIEGSTRLWEQEPERMREALARHDAIARAAVESHRGTLVKTTGDGIHAAFEDPCDALAAALAIQQGLAEPQATAGLPLRVRGGLHTGVVERRDRDFFGTSVNRAARIMAIAHGGQTLVSHALADLVRGRLPADVSLRDLGSVRLRDLSGSERVFQLVHPALRSDFPALRSLEATPNNLPQQLTTFVGRERELVEVRKLLHTARLLTLFGTGGLGKTRLALQVAAAAIVDYPDGVWFVDLATIADARLVPQVVASVLGVKEEAGRPVVEALLRFAADRELLLILDNCEHVVDAAAQLAMQLLQAGAKIKVLATSREALRVRGESIYPVPALAVPEADELVDASADYAAVRLFVDRAVAAQPAFSLTERNAAQVVEICRRLDGIPLAIELAAARLRSLSVDSIASRLSDVFRLLAGGDRVALPRQQTLRALIDWSYDLLSPDELALFRRLAAFAGGWTLETAEEVCAGGDVAPESVLDLLTSLVDKSLVAVDIESGRYRLLDTVRQYAQEKLEQSGDDAQTRERHLAWFIAFAEKGRAELVGRDQVQWLQRLDVESKNLLGAYAWCAGRPDGGRQSLQMATAMKQYFHRRGLLALGHGLMTDALAHPGAQARDAERSRALFADGQLCMAMGQHDKARSQLEESLAIAREIDDRQRIAAVMQPLGLTLSALGDLAGARECYDSAIELALQIGNRRETAAALNNRAQLHQLEGELDQARPLLGQVLAIMREIEDHENIGIALLNLAMVDIETGHLDRACNEVAEALDIAERTRSLAVGQSVVEIAAGLAAAAGDAATTAKLFGAAEGQNARTGMRRSAADEAFLAPRVARAREALGSAGFDGCMRESATLSLADALGVARAFLARAGQPVAAAR
jgi:predicted ATPase/class 3 adenylate cyclase